MAQVAFFARALTCRSPQAAGVGSALSRLLTSSSSAQHAEPQLAAVEPSPSVPRWVRELGVVRTDWTREEVSEVYSTPLLDLVFRAATVHRMYNDPSM
ncbi:Biotin synthase, partial [Tetrabaena socialis]